MIIYVAAHDENSAKIGITGNLKRRLEALKTGCQFPLSMRAAIRVQSREDAERIEAMAHKELVRSRASGEWFNVSPSIAYDVVKRAAEDLSFSELEVELAAPPVMFHELVAWYLAQLESYSSETVQRLRGVAGMSEDSLASLAEYFAIKARSKS